MMDMCEQALPVRFSDTIFRGQRASGEKKIPARGPASGWKRFIARFSFFFPLPSFLFFPPRRCFKKVPFRLEPLINMPRHAPHRLSSGTSKLFFHLNSQPPKCPDHFPCHKQSTKATARLIKTKKGCPRTYPPQPSAIHPNEMHLISAAAREKKKQGRVGAVVE